ncbi:hypothetical protein [Alteribacter keqinensis]|uniref:Uncharacterized protein n=1 Tax=Alteribacter keqinensis TaxID=2483800 RepID=A0A3M7TWT9_9BACI|nr:hypothetical protein [Alteribacter keqinensis]RNA70077.1 hypothetical protein EBO34_09155 [Alteribacter keqinensis]
MASLTERLLNHNIYMDNAIPLARKISHTLIKNNEPDHKTIHNQKPYDAPYALFFLTIATLAIQDLVNKRYLTLRKPALTRFLEKGLRDPQYNEALSGGEEALKRELLSRIHRLLPTPAREERNPKTEDLTDWLTAWKTRPHAEKYKQFYHSIQNSEDQAHLKKHALGELRPHRLHPGVKRVYFALLAFHEEWDIGLTHLLADDSDPLACIPEQLTFIKKSLPSPAVVAFLHQWIERLIEKRTGSHYKEAVRYVAILQDLYEKSGRAGRFDEWLVILRTRYSGYTAFRKELDRFEQER